MFFKKAETQVWTLIIFSITIIIATWLLATISFFYKKYLDNKKYVSILWNIKSQAKDLQYLWLCISSTWAKISYNPMYDKYKLICTSDLWKDFSKISNIKLKLYSWCWKNANFCEYKIIK